MDDFLPHDNLKCVENLGVQCFHADKRTTGIGFAGFCDKKIHPLQQNSPPRDEMKRRVLTVVASWQRELHLVVVSEVNENLARVAQAVPNLVLQRCVLKMESIKGLQETKGALAFVCWGLGTNDATEATRSMAKRPK